jgi:hypothetical protein
MANKIKIAGRTFNIGSKLGAGELKKIAKKTEYTPESIVRRLSNDRNVKLASSANKYVRSSAQTTQSDRRLVTVMATTIVDNNNNNNNNNNTGTDLG